MNGFAFLALAVVTSSAVAMTMKVSSTRGFRLGPFLAVNYLVASLALFAGGAWWATGFASPLIWTLGVFVGFMYILSLWLFNRAIAAAGLALSTTLMRLSATLPTLGSLLFFAERINRLQLFGIVLAFACLPLAGKTPLRIGRFEKMPGDGMIWGFLLFAVYGVTDFAFKVQSELAPMTDPKAFMAIIFGTALLLTTPQFFKGARPGSDCLLWGFVLGVTNTLATYFWIRTLAHFPGSVAYPCLGIGVIALTTLASLWLWRERLRPSNYLFLVLAGVAIVMINLG